MSRFAVYLGVGFLSLAAGPVAMAADVADPVYDWSGIYAGVHAGYLWGDVDLTEDSQLVVSGETFDGFVGGPLAGVNWQHDNWVIGAEADFGWSTASGTGVVPLDSYAYDLDWNAHLRARAGFAADNILLFVAGGLALAEFHVTEVGGRPEGTTYAGFTIGGGVDYAASENLVLRVEYLHDEFGTESYLDGKDVYTADIATDTLRAVVSYKFQP